MRSAIRRGYCQPPVLLATLLLLAPVSVSAQEDFFRVSPGPLSAAHKKWDDSSGCTKCHKLGGGVTNFLCLDCHNHNALRDAIAKKHGLHATFTRPCITCHTEHKGRQHYISNWSSLGGQARFNHKKTGFPLIGSHASVACSSCHKKRLKSGRTSYVGLVADCDTCHQNPHSFTNQALRKKCNSCHVPGLKRQMRAVDVPFSHGKVTGIALAGKHGTTRCTKCHKGGKMAIRGAPRTCSDCHRTPHGKSFRDRRCKECHTPSKKWKQTGFDHSRTKFPLEGKHAKIICSKCHKTKDHKPKRACTTCHKDPHAKRFGKRKCEGCHTKGGMVSFASMGFDHANSTKFKLFGKHATTWCRSCHRGKGPRDFEKIPSVACGDCHRHKNAHKGQFKGRACTECHKQGGSRSLRFEHDKVARFPRVGLHEKVKCKKCHKKGSYRSGKVRCVDCHRDPHKGKLGDSCDRCHVPDTKFAKTASKLEHNRVSKFALEAKHTKVPCKKCHPDRNYKTGKGKCFDCHGDKDPHEGKLGKTCDTCHIPDKGAPKFVHATMTKFPRSDSHAKVACNFCHWQRDGATAPPKVGWTVALAKEPVNKLFPTMGKRCADCHADKHEGRYGDACDSCHRPTKFAMVSAATHDTGFFRLGGIHDSLPCERCHTPNRLLEGIGELCQLCHAADDAHNNALGPFCGECHTQLDWLPPQFNHIETVFPLRGAHVTARCRDCHGVGTYQGVPTQCEFCHLQDALGVRDPIHAGPAFVVCDDCHDVVSFVGARYVHTTFPLLGRHALVRCRSCHSTGGYVGVPTDCNYCHYTAFLDPRNTPNHVTAACATSCEDCHSPDGWQTGQRCPGP